MKEGKGERRKKKVGNEGREGAREEEGGGK